MIFCAVILNGSVFASSSKQMTAELFFEKLEAFKEEVYANGSKYKNREELYMGIECYGFANQIAIYFYGSYPTYDSRGLRLYPDWDISYGSAALQDLHIGDIVRFRSSAGADHSIFITGFDDEKVYFSDANNDHHNTVRHNAEMTWEKLIGKMDKSLQRDSSCIGWVAHYKYWDSDPEHAGIGTVLNFNANGGYIAGEKTADRYVVLDTLNMRSGPGVEYDRVTKMYDDTYFEVPLGAQTAEADGYVWSEVVKGDHTGWAVISEAEWCKIDGAVMSSAYSVRDEDGTIYKTADTRVYTVTVTEDSVLPDQKTFGLTIDGAEFSGWSDAPDGKPISMKELLDEAHGPELTLYAVWEWTGEAEDTVKVLKGDINGDGMVDNKDVVTLFNTLSSNKKNEAPPVCDVNEDGGIDNKDLTYLFRMLSVLKTSEPETEKAPETETEKETEETEQPVTETEAEGTDTEETAEITEPSVSDTPEVSGSEEGSEECPDVYESDEDEIPESDEISEEPEEAEPIITE
ncbi:MAG: dockerin type I repeat-containing protein [Clostridia bacterium]|nr:dockerin type I repeat-containing protein [Clostridia bacterium]